MFGLELRYDCNHYHLVDSTGGSAEGFRAAILRSWPHGMALGPRRGLATFRRGEKRRQMVRHNHL